jgi:hypothetical protein
LKRKRKKNCEQGVKLVAKNKSHETLSEGLVGYGLILLYTGWNNLAKRKYNGTYLCCERG